MKIIELSDDKKEAWNNFVRHDPQGTFFHLAEWKEIIERAFGFKTYYLYAEKGGEIRGILPLALVKRPFFGSALISTPLCVYGGALGARQELEKVATQKAQELNVEYLELRQQTRGEQDWPVCDTFYSFQKILQDDTLKSIPRKQRAEVRKGIAHNLETRVNQDIDLFYKIYATSVRNLGTPVFPKKYLRILMEIFGEQCQITSIHHQNTPLTSVLSFRYKDQILPYYGGGLPVARRYSAYPYMYWTIMENAVENGVRVFDFGRSMKDTGAFAFKKNFGFEPQHLPYQSYLVNAESIPDMSPENARNKLLLSTWKKLPLSIANQVGPFLYPAIV